MKPLVKASGAVVLRGDPNEREVLVVHRPRYHDWSLPKGKMHPDEYPAVTAFREVREETGHTIRLIRPLNNAQYPTQSRSKVVYWWLAEVASDVVLDHDDETDKVEWWPEGKAIRELSYLSDVDTTIRGLRGSRRPPLLIVRHTKALPRKEWQGIDSQRPLTERGRHQAKELVKLFTAFGVSQLASSSSTRCMKTLHPYATEVGLPIAPLASLSEESAIDNPKGVHKTMAKLAEQAHSGDLPMAICGHRPVLPAMLAELGVSFDNPLKPGEVALLYSDTKPLRTLRIPPTQ